MRRANQMPNCSLLEWDSAFFGYPIARLYERRVDATLLAEAFDWCGARAARCLYYLAPADDFSSLLAAQVAGMQFIDVRLTLAREVASGRSWAVEEMISPASVAERAALVDLAPYLARASRFWADPRFGSENAVRMYEAWLRREAGVILVARNSAGPTGCITCNVEPDGSGLVDLLVVAPGGRGRGLGLALCNAALRWFAEQGCHEASVVTQGHNVASQRVYQRAGFVTQNVEVWFHKWFDTC
jgi:dTDP-4-amino-4,6-dideoxy-D-galactose acyltransferase